MVCGGSRYRVRMHENSMKVQVSTGYPVAMVRVALVNGPYSGRGCEVAASVDAHGRPRSPEYLVFAGRDVVYSRLADVAEDGTVSYQVAPDGYRPVGFAPEPDPLPLAMSLVPYLDWPLHFEGVCCEHGRDCPNVKCAPYVPGSPTTYIGGRKRTVRQLLADIRNHATATRVDDDDDDD